MRLEPGQQVSEVARILVNYFDFVNLVRKPKKKRERDFHSVGESIEHNIENERICQ